MILSARRGADHRSGGRQFRHDLRKDNNALAFSSLGVDHVDHSVDGPVGTFNSRCGGSRLSHLIGSLLPGEGDPPAFAQVYMTGDDAESQVLHPNAFYGDSLDPVILESLQAMMQRSNLYCTTFLTAKERMLEDDSLELRVKIERAHRTQLSCPTDRPRHC